MKKLIILCLLFVSCGNKERRCRLTMINGSGLSYSSSVVKCDSFQMHNNTSATVWVDGIEMKVVASRQILPHTE